MRMTFYVTWLRLRTYKTYTFCGVHFLRDPDDDMVLECAVASGSQYIITHNVKDFKRAPELKVNAIRPAEFLTLLRSKS